MKTTPSSHKWTTRREYDIVRRAGDGNFGIWHWLPCPLTPPLMSTPQPGMTPNGTSFVATVVHVHHRWILVGVRRSFKAALKWTRAQQKEARDAAAG